MLYIIVDLVARLLRGKAWTTTGGIWDACLHEPECRSIKLRSLLEKTKKHTKTRRFEHQKLKNIKREREKL